MTLLRGVVYKEKSIEYIKKYWETLCEEFI